jgi:hypothetical protein
MRHLFTYVLVVAALAAVIGTASAKNATITLPIGGLDARSGARGDYYVVDFAVPDEVIGKRLDSVLLELALDVSANSPEDSDNAPVVGVFPLSQSLASSGPSATPLFETGVASVRPVAVGDNRMLTIDITDIVKGWIAAPATNHGLIIGTLSGPAVGTISLKSAALGPSTALRVTFFYQNRFGDRISERSNN